MKIRELSRKECFQVLARNRLARLACAKENQPYVVPVYLAYDAALGGESCLYGFTTPGQKLQWMRSNPRVCVEVDEVGATREWVSVVAVGRYEELPAIDGCIGKGRPQGRVGEESSIATAPETPGVDDQRQRAWQVLKMHPMWQEPGSSAWASRAGHDSAEPFISVFFRINIDHVTGHESIPEHRDEVSSFVRPSLSTRLLRRMFSRAHAGQARPGADVSRDGSDEKRLFLEA